MYLCVYIHIHICIHIYIHMRVLGPAGSQSEVIDVWVGVLQNFNWTCSTEIQWQKGTSENRGFQRHHRAVLNTCPSIVGKLWCNPNLRLPSVLSHLIYQKHFSHAVSVCIQNDLLLLPVGLFVRIYRTQQNSDVKTLFFNPDISLKIRILLKWR